jgi:hypothetical protein
MEQFNPGWVLHVPAAPEKTTCLVLKNVSISLKKVRFQMQFGGENESVNVGSC